MENGKRQMANGKRRQLLDSSSAGLHNPFQQHGAQEPGKNIIGWDTADKTRQMLYML